MSYRAKSTTLLLPHVLAVEELTTTDIAATVTIVEEATTAMKAGEASMDATSEGPHPCDGPTVVVEATVVVVVAAVMALVAPVVATTWARRGTCQGIAPGTSPSLGSDPGEAF